MRTAAAVALIVAFVLSGAAYASETISYTYDARGRLVTVVHSGTVNNGITTTYTNDAADNRSQVVTTGASH